MRIETRHDAKDAIADAADLLSGWIAGGAVRQLMVAGGNTPLPLYEAVARRRLDTSRLFVSVLDEYAGVSNADPRTCTNLLRANVAEAWGVPPARFFGLSSDESEAEQAVLAHERRIEEAGGLDAIVLGLGKNGHLGFNEPGRAEDSSAGLLDLEPASIEANRRWFASEYAPSRGATVGLRTILSATRVLLLAFGAGKADAVHAMVRGPRSPSCPASFLRGHLGAYVFLDELAASRIGR